MDRIILLILVFFSLLGQSQLTVPADSLRGALRPERTCFDVIHYDLLFDIRIKEQSIKGSNDITFLWKHASSQIQLDLFENMKIDSIVMNGQRLKYDRKANSIFVHLIGERKIGKIYHLEVFFGGKPIIAKKPPWDGGFTWKQDDNGNPWIGTSVQGIGASLFWPNKDHLSDEVDSMQISAIIPKTLQFVTNGNFVQEADVSDTKKLVTWKVSYPINNYNVSLNVADYVHFSDTLASPLKETPLALDYYVLSYNLDKAKEQFKQVKPMLKCFERAYGPYPFWNDGYALVETPYLGMEHQSAIAYGNNYQPGYAGKHFPGFEFDYLMIHETGHEYWGNSLSMKDLADMWIHEGFCTYSESVYIECLEGYERAMDYIANQRVLIRDQAKIQGEYDINHAGDGDMYYKGAWMLNSMRHTLENDFLWWDLMENLSVQNAVSSVDASTIFNHFNQYHDFQPMFDQFLNHANAPLLEVKKTKEGFEYRWNCEVKDFNMKMKYRVGDGNWVTIQPTHEFQLEKVDLSSKEELELGERFFYFKTKWIQ